MIKIRRILRPALVAFGFVTLVAGGGLREDEIDCEQAVAHLQECCPDFAATATLRCEFDDGCGVIEPALSIPASQCILDESCEQIVESGICQRAHDLPSPNSNDDHPAPVPEVCP